MTALRDAVVFVAGCGVDSHSRIGKIRQKCNNIDRSCLLGIQRASEIFAKLSKKIEKTPAPEFAQLTLYGGRSKVTGQMGRPTSDGDNKMIFSSPRTKTGKQIENFSKALPGVF